MEDITGDRLRELATYYGRLPSRIPVAIKLFRDGLFSAQMPKTLPGLIVEAQSYESLIDRLNDAVMNACNVPSGFRPHLRVYAPSIRAIGELTAGLKVSGEGWTDLIRGGMARTPKSRRKAS